MTLHTYFALKYLKVILTTFFLISLLLILIDLIEHSRKFSYYVDFLGILHLTLLNLPKSIYEIIDLTILISYLLELL